jgi:hypothetical protein
MVSRVHKNTNAPKILIVCDVIYCMMAKHISGDFSRGFSRGPRLFRLPNCPERREGQLGGKKNEIANYVFCPHK